MCGNTMDSAKEQHRQSCPLFMQGDLQSEQGLQCKPVHLCIKHSSHRVTVCTATSPTYVKTMKNRIQLVFVSRLKITNTL